MFNDYVTLKRTCNMSVRKESLINILNFNVHLLCHPKRNLSSLVQLILASMLELPSLFAAWLFWTFHTKSHNMKALVILSHSWSPFLPLTCWYGTNELLWVFVQPSRVFSQEKIPPRLHMKITWPWPPVGRFSHGLVTVRQKKMWT